MRGKKNNNRGKEREDKNTKETQADNQAGGLLPVQPPGRCPAARCGSAQLRCGRFPALTAAGRPRAPTAHQTERTASGGRGFVGQSEKVVWEGGSPLLCPVCLSVSVEM